MTSILENDLLTYLNVKRATLEVFIEGMKIVPEAETDEGRTFNLEEVKKLQEHIERFGLTTKEAAAQVGVTEQTIKKRLQPWNKDTWRIDGSFLYHFNEVLKLADEMNKPGMTPNDVVEYLREQYSISVSPTTVYQRLKAGEIPATVQTYRGISTYFIQQEAVDKNIHLFRNKHQSESLQDEHSGYCLFQLLVNNTGELARIIQINNPDSPLAITGNDEQISLEELRQRGFEPIYQPDVRKKINKKGYVSFKFFKPRSVKSIVYELIDLFYQNIGAENLRVKQKNDHIVVEVKPGLIPLDHAKHADEITLLKDSLIRGKIALRPNEMVLDTDLEAFVGWGTSALKEQAKRYAAAEQLDLEDFIIQCIEEGIARRKDTL